MYCVVIKESCVKEKAFKNKTKFYLKIIRRKCYVYKNISVQLI